MSDEGGNVDLAHDDEPFATKTRVLKFAGKLQNLRQTAESSSRHRALPQPRIATRQPRIEFGYMILQVERRAVDRRPIVARRRFFRPGPSRWIGQLGPF